MKYRVQQIELMTAQKFNVSKQYIADKIFVPEPPKQGEVWTNLNVTILPDYLAYIKLNLSKEEQLLLSQYHLQTYLLETALKPHPKNDFDTCTNQIINHIRHHPQFWVRKKGSEQQSLKMHQAIEEYHQDCKMIEQSKIGSNFVEKQYKIFEGRKIEDDYVYMKNQYIKAAHRFCANLYPWLADYLLSATLTQWKHPIKAFVIEFIANMAIKSRPKIKFHSQPTKTENQKKMSLFVQKQVANFTEYLEKNNVDYKCLSSIKDYYLITNSLVILKKFIDQYTQAQTAQQNVQDKQANILQMNENIQQIMSDSANRFIIDQEICQIIKWLNEGQFIHCCNLINKKESLQRQSIQRWKGFLGSIEELQQAFDQFSDIVNHPQNTNRMKYKLEGSQVPWTEEQYLKFLGSFLQFFNVPTNNKKIAISMGKDIQPNHVKHVKGIYMRNMSIRIDNGEIGGGKKGLFQSKIQFLKKDIQNFNMKWFKKQAKIKSRRLKKRRKRQTYDGEEHDSDY